MKIFATILFVLFFASTLCGQTITALTVTNGSSIYSVDVGGKTEVVADPTVIINGRQATIGALVDRMSNEKLNITLNNNVITATSNFTSMTTEPTYIQETVMVKTCGPNGCFWTPRVVQRVAAATVNTLHTVLPPYRSFGADCGCGCSNCNCGGQSLDTAQNYFVQAQGLTYRQARVLNRRARWLLFWR